MKKRILAGLLSMVMALSLCACGSTSSSTSSSQDSTDTDEADEAEEEEEEEEEEETDVSVSEEADDTETASQSEYWPSEYLKDSITIATSSDGGGFSPVGGSPWGSVQMCMYEKLMVVDSDGNIYYQMLKSITEIDELTYECELWDCIYDTAGNNITAEDVKFSFQLFVDEGQKGALNRLNLLDDNTVDLEIVDDYTFIWHCSAPFQTGEFEKNFSNVSVFSQKSYEASGDDQFVTEPVGTGPYMVEDYVVGSKVTLVANPDYWMKNIDDEEWLAENFYYLNAQNVREIEIDIIIDSSTRAMALEMGEVCAIDTANAIDIEAYLADESYGITAIQMKVNAPVAFYFNCNEESICSDVNMRKAICYAIDNTAIADGSSYPASPAYGIQPNMYDAPESWLTGEDREYYTYDLEKSKEYQELAGYNGETITIMYIDESIYQDTMILLQAQLREAGINLELYPVDNGTLESYQFDFTKFDMVGQIMGGGNYLVNTLKKFWSGDSASNEGETLLGVLDETLEDLYLAIVDDNSEENIEAYDQYFTDEMCYGYAMIVYYTQTGCLSWVNAAVDGTKLVPGAFTFND